MTALGDAFKKAYDSQGDRQLVRAVCRAVEDAIFPFDPGDIQLDTWYNIDYWNHTLRVVVERFPNYDFAFVLSGDDMLRDEHATLNRFYSELFHHYRYRPALPVDDHILLGED